MITFTLPHVSTNLQVADIFTKALTRPRHQFFADKLMLVILKGGEGYGFVRVDLVACVVISLL